MEKSFITSRPENWETLTHYTYIVLKMEQFGFTNAVMAQMKNMK